VLLLAAGCTESDSEYSKSYSVTGHPVIRVDTDNGSVLVTASDTHQVDFFVTTQWTGWEGNHRDGPRIDSRQDGDLVELTTREDWHSGFGRTRIEVRMPADADLQLQTRNGSVRVSSLSGHIVAHTSSGAITASQLAGTIELDSRNGSIRVDELRGALQASTANGAISIANLDGRCVAATRNGSVRVGGRFEFLDLESANGAVAAHIDPGSRISDPWSIHTSRGSVHLDFPADFKADLEASTSRGAVTASVPLEVQDDFAGSHIRGKLNGGGPAVRVRTESGSIHIASL